LATTRVLGIIVSFTGSQLLPTQMERMAALLSEHASAQAAATRVVEAP
jgi:hypothetical protein